MPENQTLLASILEIAREAIISIDSDQKIVVFNKGAEQIFGYEADEVIGKPVNMLLPPRFEALHHAHIAEFAAGEETTRLMGQRREIFGLRKDGTEFPAAASISKLETPSGKQVLTVVLRDITERKQAEAERERLITQLHAVNEAARAVTAQLSLEQVLQKIADTARALVQARYAALGVHDGQGSISRFVVSGITEAEYKKIGAFPMGRGLLGMLLHEGKSVIVDNMAQHPKSVGFPENHPPMKSLLGVPIYAKEQLIGALYLTDKTNGELFSPTDQQVIEMLALHAAIAIENARLYEKTQRLAVLEERDRFARDLHDGIIQSLYGVGLALDGIKSTYAEGSTTNRQLELIVKSLAHVITDVRNYIFDLRPQALKDKGLHARLEGLIREMQVNTALSVQTDVSPDINQYVTDRQASHLFHIAHEALSNAARHAQAKKVYISLLHEAQTITLMIEDDGVGFDPSDRRRHGHRGLSNMQSRAKSLGTNIEFESAPGEGTRLTLSVQATPHQQEATQ